MSQPEIGAGDIEIELDGNILYLKPTLSACQRISAMRGGLNASIEKCLQMDFDAICQVISAGLDLNPTQSKMIPEAVFKAGLYDVSAKAIEFISVVGNGGRPLDEDDDEGEREGEEPADPLVSETTTES